MAHHIDPEKFQFPVRSRVRLNPDFSDPYTLAPAGAEGTIMSRRIEPLGDYPMIYVKWDRDHWTYNGQDDMWTFENHFELVEPPKAAIDDLPNPLKKLLDAIQEARSMRYGEDPDDLGYLEVLERAANEAEKGLAFLLITINETEGDEPGVRIQVPTVYSSYRSDVAGLVLEAQLSQLGASSHLELALAKAQSLMSLIERDENE